MEQEALFELRCVGCSRYFEICRPDYRGHKYCAAECAAQARKLKVAEYNRRYRASFDGRLNRADLERARRERLREADRFTPDEVSRKFVDDHTSAAGEDFDMVPPPDDSMDEPSPTEEVSHVHSYRRPTPHRCIVCGRQSYYVIPFGEPWPRRRRAARGPP